MLAGSQRKCLCLKPRSQLFMTRNVISVEHPFRIFQGVKQQRLNWNVNCDWSFILIPIILTALSQPNLMGCPPQAALQAVRSRASLCDKDSFSLVCVLRLLELAAVLMCSKKEDFDVLLIIIHADNKNWRVWKGHYLPVLWCVRSILMVLS